jgi:GDPmannose 4,6-dehydratase
VKKALICGVSGQDVAYLALLLNMGYVVWGTSRDAQIAGFGNLAAIEIKTRVKLLSMAPNVFRSLLTPLHIVKPMEFITSPGKAFE